MSTLTPSARIGSVACCRVYVGGYTFRLARGDDRVAVFDGVCIEQKQWLIIDEPRFPGPVIAGPAPVMATIAKPTGLEWSDHRRLTALARHWLHSRYPRTAPATGADRGPDRVRGAPTTALPH